MIINLGCASVDNHIPGDDIFDYHPLRECNIYIISTYPLKAKVLPACRPSSSDVPFKPINTENHDKLGPTFSRTWFTAEMYKTQFVPSRQMSSNQRCIDVDMMVF